ncbi:plastocyanin/azurin family copper-binding protein [Nitrosopumilus sp. Nsub]|uniref:cupredoxin domain-containing protein n=1 Tax=Nitrosopumilus sp. Nsub TaxID=1776294 RepID=UPI00082DFA94|nr:plastocyanin/azurin family copper-binding protein [Nitrosopumilus sp. Nsub]
MKNLNLKLVFFSISVLILISLSTSSVNAENVPAWIKNNALWYGQGHITETEFLNSIKFLIENDILVLEKNEPIKRNQLEQIIIPNGNYVVSGGNVYLPLNLEIRPMTTVQWINNDIVLHTVQSQDEFGEIIGLFNSAPLKSGETFEFKFTEEGVYNYFCSLHPWRVGLVTVR